MKKKNERNARKEEARKELKPEVQDGVKLTDEQMEQVSGGAGPHEASPASRMSSPSPTLL